ncbi:MAG: GMC family oxidoreductase N-terminal domain-containing protein [Candidimonas sp.]
MVSKPDSEVQAGSTQTFDYVIVGGGAAGCVLAARLTEDPDVSVCLLESGSPDRHPLIRIPAGVIKLLFNPRLAWQFKTQPSEGTAGRPIFAPQGRTLGGSSSINGMIYNRGLASDFDTWSAMGNPGWDYAGVLPYFRKSQKRIGGPDSDYVGRHGVLPVSDNDWKLPLVDAFLAGVHAKGLPKNPDYNGATQLGAGYLQRVIEGGRRVSAARAFLRPAMRRPGLAVRTNAHATQVLFEGRRAVGVRFTFGGQAREVRARREVIVAAGAINTPKLLQLSGVGDEKLLRSLGIPVVLNQPAVGENLQDHYGTRTVVRVRNSRTANNLARWPWLGLEIGKWLLRRPSILGLASSLAYVFWKSEPKLAEPDLQFVLTPISFKQGQFGVLDDFAGMSMAVWVHRPESRGFVRLQSTDPRQDPLIQPNYLQAPADQRAHVVGVRLTREFLGTEELSRYVANEEVPGAVAQTDEQLLDFARRYGSTIYHFCGTCRMGAADDPQAVVGPDLRVHGLDGLRVVDASVMPTVPSGNTYAPTLMIAEKGADMIRAAYRKA